MVFQLPTLAGATPLDAARAAGELANVNPNDFHTSLETGDILILEKNSAKSIAFITSISAGEEAKIGLSSQAPPTAGQTSARLCRVVKKEIVGLLRQPVGKWRSSPATGARAKITSFDTGEDGVTTVKLALIVTEGGDEAAVEMPISEFLSSYPAGAGAEGDAADAGADDAEPTYAALRALFNATRGFSASDVADEAGEEELDAFRIELYKAKDVAADEAVTAARARAGADAALRPLAGLAQQLRTGGSAPTIKTAGILAMRFLNSVGTAAAAPAPTATGTQAQGGPALERQPAGVAEPAFLRCGTGAPASPGSEPPLLYRVSGRWWAPLQSVVLSDAAGRDLLLMRRVPWAADEGFLDAAGSAGAGSVAEAASIALESATMAYVWQLYSFEPLWPAHRASTSDWFGGGAGACTRLAWCASG